MRKILPLISTIILIAISTPPVEAANTTVRNCVNIKTGAARLVSATAKCKSGEKLVTLVVPPVDIALISIVHSGKTPPIDNTIGHDGDFYVDTTLNQIYGPRTNGIWGLPVNLAGSQGKAGINGSTIVSGEGAPDLVIGLYGDFYLDTKNIKLYGPKNERVGWGIGISLVGPQGPTGATGPQGPAGANGANGSNGATGGYGSYGSFYDTSTVVLTKDVATAVPLNSTSFANGISIVGGSKITFASAGKYNIAFSSQVTKADSGDDTVSVWLCKGANGAACTNIPWSNTDVIFSGNNSRHVLAWNFFVNVNANEYVQLMISSAGTTLQTSIVSVPAQSTPTRPEIPGTIVTVNQVG